MPDIKNRIEYANGEVFIDIGENIIGFDILLSGKYELESVDITNFIIKYNKHRVIGIGINKTLGKEAFLKYKGDFRILKCVAVKDNLEKVYLQPYGRTDAYMHNFNNFDGENENFEDLDFNGVEDYLPTKIKTTFLNEKIYDKDGKKIDIEAPVSKEKTKEILKTVRKIRTTSATGGRY